MDVITGTTRNNGNGVSDPLIKQATADGLWHFCLQHYANTEVQQSCMVLQEKYNGNINLVLFLAWLEHAGYSLDLNALVLLQNTINESDGLIRRYRLMRRELKQQLNTQSYNKMLNFELSLEKHQQYEIVRYANEQQWHSANSSTVMLYCELLDKNAKELYPYLMKGLRSFSVNH